MALTFPLSLQNLADLLPIESAPWNLVYQQEFSGLGSGEGLAHDLAPPLLEAEVSTGPMYNDDAYAVQARLNALMGSVQSFYLTNPAKPGPRMDPKGEILGSATPALSFIGANRKIVRINSLPAGYVISAGDFFHVDYGTGRRALIQAVEASTASAGGVAPEFEVTPHLRPGVTTTLAVQLIKPAAKVKLVPGTFRLENSGALHSRLRFTARQTLAAN